MAFEKYRIYHLVWPEAEIGIMMFLNLTTKMIIN